ncbi:MAG TPA: hypothetical protein VGG34_14780 [Opitutaceae bacterium]|jgi:hypothetical protein
MTPLRRRPATIARRGRLPGAAVLAALAASLQGAPPGTPTAKDAAAADRAARQGATMMKRFIVSAARVDKPWHYASLPGFEILSRAPPKETGEMLDSLRRGLWIENSVMPRDWLPAAPVPYTVIIDDTDLQTVPVGQPASEAITLEAPSDAQAWGSLGKFAMTWSDQMPAHDEDTVAFNTNIFGVDFKYMSYGSITLGRLMRCAPPLPRWLVAGLIGRTSGIFREGVVPIISRGIFDAGWIHHAVCPGSIWVSVEEGKRIADGGEVAIPPLSSLFSEDPPPAGSLPAWESEAALFVRWSLLGPGSDDPATAHALSDLVRRARTEPVTEKAFTECFGFGYAAMGEKLGAYLRTVVNKPMTIDLDMPAGFPKPRLGPATADQVGRILGDWLRMEADSLGMSDPEMSREALYLAGRTLVRAYRQDTPAAAPPQADTPRLGPFDLPAAGVRDARMLAVLGLYAFDSGRNDKAVEYLRPAAGAGVTRPRAYGVLAQALLAEALARPGAPGGRISAGQLGAVLAPLRVALKAEPSAGAYRLLAEAWMSSAARPGGGDVAEIAGAAAKFPRDIPLAGAAARLLAAVGRPDLADAVTRRALAFGADEEAMRQLGMPGPARGAPVKPGR